MRFSKISPPAFSPLPMGEQQPAAVELFLEISVENCNVEQSSQHHHPLRNLEYMQIKNISTPVAQ